MNHEKNKKHQKRVPTAGQTAFKVVKTSRGKPDALKLAEFQIAVSQCRGKAAPYPPFGGTQPFVGAPQYILYQ